MITININEFTKYDKAAFCEYLLLQNESNFEIKIPKKTLDSKDDNFTMFTEYSHAAYAGQLLFEMADNFKFYYRAVGQALPFTFIIQTKEIEKLAELIYQFDQVFCDRDDNELIEEFEARAMQFYIDAFDRILITAPYGLLCVARECLEKSWKA